MRSTKARLPNNKELRITDLGFASCLMCLLPGEVAQQSFDEVVYQASESPVKGKVFLSNYRLVFCYTKDNTVREKPLVPVGSIQRLLDGNLPFDVVILRMDMKAPILLRFALKDAKLHFHDVIEFAFAYSYKPKWNPAQRHKRTWATHQPNIYSNNNESFCLYSEYNVGMSGIDLYDASRDFQRIGIPLGGSDLWRPSHVNMNFALCPSYPERLFVPTKATDEMLKDSADFRAKRRLPVLSWLHPTKKSALCRSSQPKAGVFHTICQADVDYLQTILAANPTNNNVLFVYDSRAIANAEANRAMGAGYESTKSYNFVQLEFQNIANIHTMRSSHKNLYSTCINYKGPEDLSFLSHVHSSGWLIHLSTVLNAADRVAKRICDGNSVLVHCSDGWDRTSQVVSLALLMLDPYYRTITGFCVLIEKEFLSMGHKIATRASFLNKTNEESPIFLQFIDCVFQLVRLFPKSFEFNEQFLITILDKMYCARFGTFLTDSEYDRVRLGTRHLPSLWTYLHQEDNFYNYINPIYCPPSEMSSTSPNVLSKAAYSPHNVVLWQNYYLRASIYKDDSRESLINTAQELQFKISQLLEVVQGVDPNIDIYSLLNVRFSGETNMLKHMRRQQKITKRTRIQQDSSPRSQPPPSSVPPLHLENLASTASPSPSPRPSNGQRSPHLSTLPRKILQLSPGKSDGEDKGDPDEEILVPEPLNKASCHYYPPSPVTAPSSGMKPRRESLSQSRAALKRSHDGVNPEIKNHVRDEHNNFHALYRRRSVSSQGTEGEEPSPPSGSPLADRTRPKRIGVPPDLLDTDEYEYSSSTDDDFDNQKSKKMRESNDVTDTEEYDEDDGYKSEDENPSFHLQDIPTSRFRSPSFSGKNSHNDESNFDSLRALRGENGRSGGETNCGHGRSGGDSTRHFSSWGEQTGGSGHSRSAPFSGFFPVLPRPYEYPPTTTTTTEAELELVPKRPIVPPRPPFTFLADAESQEAENTAGYRKSVTGDWIIVNPVKITQKREHQ